MAQNSDQDESSGRAAGTVNSVEGLENRFDTCGVDARRAEYYIQNKEFDKAIACAESAIRIKPDTDLHQILADALEHKLRQQREKDPKLFLRAVSEWLIAYRQEGGEEMLSSHGLSIPGLQHLYGDEDRNLLAKQHVQALTGRLPKMWETNQKFLDSVSKQLERSVHAKVVEQASSQ